MARIAGVNIPTNKRVVFALQDIHGIGPAKAQEIIVGSPVTGRSVLVCHSDTSYSARGFGQLGHPHAYLTSDFRRVVFNSDRTGRPQLYVADLPDGFLDGLEG